jgi:hypothetical protein
VLRALYVACDVPGKRKLPGRMRLTLVGSAWKNP